MPGPGERRQSPRYPVNLHVELGRTGATTRDMSASGVFFDTREPCVAGAPIRFALVLARVDPVRPLRLECAGRVVRVESRGDLFGVAAVITSCRVESPSRRPGRSGGSETC
jgi:hypothetical protein